MKLDAVDSAKLAVAQTARDHEHCTFVRAFSKLDKFLDGTPGNGVRSSRANGVGC